MVCSTLPSSWSERGRAYANAESFSAALYRADGRCPHELARVGGMRPHNSPDNVKSELLAALRSAAKLREYAQVYISTNPKNMVSCATDLECGGYATNDRWLYEITLDGSWYMLTGIPPVKRVGGNVIKLFADSSDLDLATRVGMDPGASTEEVDLAFEVPAAWIRVTRAPAHSPRRDEEFDVNWGDVG